MTDIHTRRGYLDADRHREKTCEDKETRWPSTSQGKRPGTDPSFTALRRNQLCKHPDLKSSASRLLLTQPAVLLFKLDQIYGKGDMNTFPNFTFEDPKCKVVEKPQS